MSFRGPQAHGDNLTNYPIPSVSEARLGNGTRINFRRVLLYHVADLAGLSDHHEYQVIERIILLDNALGVGQGHGIDLGIEAIDLALVQSIELQLRDQAG